MHSTLNGRGFDMLGCEDVETQEMEALTGLEGLMIWNFSQKV